MSSPGVVVEEEEVDGVDDDDGSVLCGDACDSTACRFDEEEEDGKSCESGGREGVGKPATATAASATAAAEGEVYWIVVGVSTYFVASC